ncbi:MAG: N-acetyl-alpha-D-glucosaminyl L-malate synthase BshA [Luteibaculaceae bacterium]
MKIGIVCYPTFGGSGVVATELGLGLAANGHQVHFITYSQPVRLGEFTENIRYHEVLMPEYPLFEFPPYETALTSKMVDVVRYEKLDVLHVHYAIPHASAAIMAREILKKEGIHIPVVTTLHGTDISLVGKDASYAPVITYAINQSNAVTAVSDSLRVETYSYFQVNRNIKVVHNFIDTKSIVPAPNNSLRLHYAPNGEKILCHISNFRPVKRIEDVVHIFKKVAEQMPAKLLMIGDGPERSKAQALCRELGTCQDVYFLGKLKDPSKVLVNCDLFLLPSVTESFGMAMLEAMACGVPVVSSNAGGITEVNRNGVSGYHNNVGDVEGMAENAVKILQNPAKHKEFKENARRNAARFDIRKILPQYEQVYQEVCGKSVVSTEKK